MSTTVQVDLGDLTLALTSHEVEHYLDLRTGEVIPWFEDLADSDEELGAAMEETPERFLLVPAIPSHDGFRWMEQFAEDQHDAAVRDALLEALDRPKPFRRFKDALLQFPTVREQWFRFEEDRLAEHAREWLRMEGVDAQLVPQRRTDEPAP